MVKYCCVNNCHSGKPGYEKVSIFGAPSNPEIYQKWEEVLLNEGCTLKRKNFYVCAKHFLSKDIHKEKVLRDDSGSIYYRRAFERPKISPTAVPCIFTDVNNTKIDCGSDTESYNAYEKNLDDTYYYESFSPCASPNQELNAGDENFTQTEEDSSMSNINEGNKNKAINNIFYSYKKIILPSTLWASYQIDLPVRMIVFSKIELLEFRETENSNAPITTKQVILHEDGKFRIYILNKLLCTVDSSLLIEDIENMIQRVDGFITCIGGPEISEFANVYSKCAYKDIAGKWRHNLCALVLEKGIRCSKCKKLEGRLQNLSQLTAKKENLLKDVRLKSAEEKHSEIRSKVYKIVKETF